MIVLTEIKLKSSWILPNKSGEETSTERLNIEASKRTVISIKIKMLI